MDQLAGTTIGRYRIERLIGKGGMAAVYRAHDPVFQRTVAIKILAPELARDQQFVDRFLREGRSMGRIQHPHVVAVHDGGQQDDTAYLVMQYIEGGNLYDRLAAIRRRGKLPVGEVLAILQAVADALDDAHRRGLVHRDVKPQNILLTERGYPYLTDFGIAKVLSTESENVSMLTQAHTIMGTPEYMSPEQAQGQPIDGRTDLYALGVILYESFTGRTPFRMETKNDTPLTILVRHASTTPPAPQQFNLQISQPVANVLIRALAKAPEDRYPTGAALMAAMRAAIATPPATPDPFDLPSATRSGASLPALPQLTPAPGPRTAATPETEGATVMVPGQTPTGTTRPPAESGPHSLPVLPSASPPRRRMPVALLIGAPVLALLLLGAVLVALRLGDRNAAAQSGNQAQNMPTVAAPVASPGGSQEPATAVPASPTPAPPTVAAALPSSTATTALPTRPAGVAGATPALAATPGQAAREVILFSSHRNDVHDSQIYTMNPDGSGQRQLTFTRGHSWGPRLSPDGQYFVFSSVAPGEHVDHSAAGGGEKGQGHHEIYRANSDGANIIRLTTTTAWNNAWAWSPDSQSLVFASDRDGNWELYRMNLKGEQVVRLTNDPAQDGWPSFTPDGKQIVFSSNREAGISQIYIMNSDGSNPRRLNRSESYDTLPSVSPDGLHIVYSAQSSDTESEIYVMNIDGSNATRLTSSIAINTDPAWSPDGKHIVFSSDREGNSNIYTMAIDGKELKRLTDDPGEDVTPFWGRIVVDADAPTSPQRAAQPPRAQLDACLPVRREGTNA